MSVGRILLIDKPAGPSSHDVVARARRVLGERRIGHTGTLDPFASGLLVLCVGPVTRLAEYLTGMEKSYQASLRLGVSTDTLDPEGQITAESPIDGVTPEAIESAFDAQRGQIEQLPPVFSAKKLAGERAYEKARRGETVELQPVAVTISEIATDEVALPDVRFHMTCSTGTYVRSVGRDVGAALGTGGHLTELRRTRVGGFLVDDAIRLDDLETVRDMAAGTHPAVLTPLQAMAHLPARELDSEQHVHLAHGRAVPWEGEDAPVALVHRDGVLLAIGRVEAGTFKPRKVFTSPADITAPADIATPADIA